ncbi:type II secretion system protein GspH [Shewanella gelidii]|uniref:Type II secretion system protein H n=2 Tax=Shewanella gelidii TaxID=1642821 RepID=A0A917NDD4_9GAMM|nr:type II secretion system protein GspH [Shewanella gelidii]
MTRKNSCGFTLLEVLLVALLMGLAAAAVTLTMGNSNKQQDLDKLALQFMAATELVLDETILSGQFLGIMVKEDQYQFVYFDDDKWQTIADDRLLSERQMPEDVTLQLVIEGLPLTQEDEEDESWFDEPFIEAETELENEVKEPEIFLFPSGEMSAFELAFSSQNQQGESVEALVVGSALGQLSLGRPDDHR